MIEKEIQNVFNLHKLSCKLKKTIRSGWKKWHCTEERLESIAEHIFGTCMLAVGVLATKKHSLDTNKIITMIMLHETEEIIIGDLTIYDKEYINKAQEGRKAVLSIFQDFDNASEFLTIIEEFEANKTPEAKFANMCDKFEADLQCYYYNDYFDMANVEDNVINDSRVVEYREKGDKTVAEFFLTSDMYKYKDEFFDMANYLNKMEKNNEKI